MAENRGTYSEESGRLPNWTHTSRLISLLGATIVFSILNSFTSQLESSYNYS